MKISKITVVNPKKYKNVSYCSILKIMGILSITFILLLNLYSNYFLLPPSLEKDSSTIIFINPQDPIDTYEKIGTRHGHYGNPENNWSSINSHIKTFINGGSSDEFLAQNFDIIIDYAGGRTNGSHLKPNLINLLYDYFGTMVPGDSNRKYQALLDYHQLHGLTNKDLEDMFLHVKEDVNYTLGEPTELDPKVTKLVRGWDPANDLNSDYYISDIEFMNRINTRASARYKNESRIPIYYWGPPADYLMNIGNDDYLDFIVNYYAPKIMNESEGYDGIFLDTLSLKPTVQGETEILEYPNINNYSTDIKILLTDLEDSLPNGTIVIGNGWYSNPIIISGSEYETWARITTSIDTEKLDSIIEKDGKKIMQLIQYNPIYHDNANPNRPDLFVEGITLSRDQLYSLSLYYLIHGNFTYYGYGVHGGYHLDEDRWFNAVHYDIGQPLNSYYILDDSSNYTFETVNILTNGNFDLDIDKDGNPDFWEIVEPIELDSNVKYSGNYSAKVDSNIEISNINKQYITLEPYTTYTLSGRIKTENLTGNGAQIYPYEFNDLQESDSWISVSGTADWTFYNMIFTTGSDINGRINFKVNGTGSVWFDDIHLTRGRYDQYTVFSREFQNATVFLKNPYRIGDNTTTTYSLNESYCKLYSDGSLGTPVNNIELKRGEGAIMVKESAIPPPPNIINITGFDLAPYSVLRNEKDVEMTKLILSVNNGSVEVTDIQIDLSGSGSDTDVAIVRLYEDIDNSETLTPSDIQIGTTQSFSSGVLTFSNLLLNVSSEIDINLLIIYDISDIAIDGNSIGCRLDNNNYISVLGQNIVNPFRPINSKNSTIISDTIHPTVNSIDISKPPPLNSGSVEITVTFSEEMDTTINPLVTTGRSPPYSAHTINQLSYSDNIWTGTLDIDSNIEDGEYCIKIEDAEDLMGNPMESSFISNPYEVDTTSPTSFIPSIPDYHNDLNINIPYSANDIGGSGVQYVELYYKKDNNSWIKCNNNITSNPILFTAPGEGVYDFFIIATDNAHNTEEPPINADASTTVDIKIPTIRSIEFSEVTPFATGSKTLKITFSEDMDTSLSPSVNFVSTSTYEYYIINELSYEYNTWIGTFNITSSTEGGTYLINISGAKDMADNEIANSNHFTFTVDTKPPLVLEATPTGIDIIRTPLITVTFDESMNQTSVENAFSIKGATTYRTITMNSPIWTDNTITFTPDFELNYGTEYIIILDLNAKDLAGNSLHNYYNWSFTTISSPEINISSIDYVQIRDRDGGLGNIVTNVTYVLEEDANGIYYCSAYNHSRGYLGEIAAKWTVTGNIGTISDSIGTSISFYADVTGIGFISVNVSGISNSTGKIIVKSDDTLNELTAPSNITVRTISSNEIRIEWTQTNHINVRGYIIQRSNKINGPWQKINIVEKDENTYLDSNLKSDSYYYYRIIAIDNLGNESPPSLITGTTTNKINNTEVFPLFWLFILILAISLITLLLLVSKKKEPIVESIQLRELKKGLPPPPRGWTKRKEELLINENKKSNLLYAEISGDELPPPPDDWTSNENLPPPDDWILEDELPPPDDWTPDEKLPPPDDWISEDELPPPDDWTPDKKLPPPDDWISEDELPLPDD